MRNDKCPACGADEDRTGDLPNAPKFREWYCGTYANQFDELTVSRHCLERQLAQVKTEITLLHSDLAEGGKLLGEFVEAKAEIGRLKGIVEKLLKTADGLPIVPGMTLYIAFKYQGGTAFVLPINSAHGWSRGGDGRLWITDSEGSNGAAIEDCYASEDKAEDAVKQFKASYEAAQAASESGKDGDA